MTRILYVEDSDDNVYMLKLRFELLDGFEVLVAEVGESGCAKAIAENPDVILIHGEYWRVTGPPSGCQALVR